MISPKVVAMMPLEMFLDFLAVRVNGPRADGRELEVSWHMSDSNETRRLFLSHGALSHRAVDHSEDAPSAIRLDRTQLSNVILSGKSFLEAFDEGMIPWEGDGDSLRALFSCLDEFYPMFNILEP